MNTGSFSEFLNDISPEPLSVLDPVIPYSKYVSLDLSESNKVLNNIDVSSSERLGAYISDYIEKNDALIGYGGYQEIRNIYKRSSHFNKQTEDGRNVHIATDLWCMAGTTIYTPLDATVHSFKNNTNYGDYGPTIILRHTVKNITFYTLYGHLSLNSIENLKENQVFKQGEQIGTLGDHTVNGDYPPHLHFQIIKDLQGNMGDYPGVCSQTDLEYYLGNCPDPNLLLKLIV